MIRLKNKDSELLNPILLCSIIILILFVFYALLTITNKQRETNQILQEIHKQINHVCDHEEKE